jgi:hypothetical protein
VARRRRRRRRAGLRSAAASGRRPRDAARSGRGAGLADEAVARAIEAGPRGLRVLQHGFAHRNHEPPATDGGRGKPAELGATRPPDVALAELRTGWARLAALVPGRLRPGLVPPWNRIAPAIRDRLPEPATPACRASGPARTAWPRPASARSTRTSTPSSGGRTSASAGRRGRSTRSPRTSRRAAPGGPNAAEPTGLLTHHRDLAGDSLGGPRRDSWPASARIPRWRSPELDPLRGRHDLVLLTRRPAIAAGRFPTVGARRATRAESGRAGRLRRRAARASARVLALGRGQRLPAVEAIVELHVQVARLGSRSTVRNGGALAGKRP